MLDRIRKALIAGIDDPLVAKHRQDVLHVLILSMVVVFLGNSVWRKAVDSSYSIPWLAYGILFGALLLNRRGHSIIASVVVVLLVPAFVATAFLIGPTQRGPLALLFLVIAPLLASTLLGGGATVAVALINLWLLTVLNASVPAIAASGAVEAMVLLTVVVTLLLLFSLRARTRVETASWWCTRAAPAPSRPHARGDGAGCGDDGEQRAHGDDAPVGHGCHHHA